MAFSSPWRSVLVSRNHSFQDKKRIYHIRPKAAPSHAADCQALGARLGETKQAVAVQALAMRQIRTHPHAPAGRRSARGARFACGRPFNPPRYPGPG